MCDIIILLLLNIDISMESNFFKKVGIALGVTTAVAGLPEAQGAETQKSVDKAVTPIVKTAGEVVDSRLNDAHKVEVNNNQEKGLDELAFANEALFHVGKGPYVSETRKGFVSLCEVGEPSKGGSFAHEYVYKVTSWAVTDSPDQLVGGYYVDFVGVGTAAKVVEGKSDLEVNVDFLKTNPIGIGYVYAMLRSQGMTPQEIQIVFEKANPKMNMDMLITALKSNEEFKKDIKMIESGKTGSEIASNVIDIK